MRPLTGASPSTNLIRVSLGALRASMCRPLSPGAGTRIAGVRAGARLSLLVRHRHGAAQPWRHGVSGIGLGRAFDRGARRQLHLRLPEYRQPPPRPGRQRRRSSAAVRRASARRRFISAASVCRTVLREPWWMKSVIHPTAAVKTSSTPASRATSRRLRLPKPRPLSIRLRAASIKALRVCSFCSARGCMTSEFQGVVAHSNKCASRPSNGLGERSLTEKKASAILVHNCSQ